MASARVLLGVVAVAWAVAVAAGATAGTIEGTGSAWKPIRRHRGMALASIATTTSRSSTSPSPSASAATRAVQSRTTPAPATTAASAASVPRRERPVDHRSTTLKPHAQSGVKIPTSSLTKPTKYHYYPHNQHIYLLPECAVQQVCNAVYVRLNFTQPLCACPSRYRDPCSASLNSDDLHTTELVTDRGGKALTLVKTCEPVADMRVCRAPRDWSLLALQNIRTGKSHYLVICRCPDDSILEGPTPHDQPTYASVPGIRVFGMTCVQPLGNRRGRPLRFRRAARHPRPAFPWARVHAAAKAVQWDD